MQQNCCKDRKAEKDITRLLFNARLDAQLNARRKATAKPSKQAKQAKQAKQQAPLPVHPPGPEGLAPNVV
jgi:hypothetical protein